MRQRLLHGKLRLAIGIDGRGGVRLSQRHLGRFAIHGARRREHEKATLLRSHRLERRERTHHVGVVVAGRIAHRFGDDEPGGKVHDRGGAAVANRTTHRVDITDVAYDERGAQGGLAVPGG